MLFFILFNPVILSYSQDYALDNIIVKIYSDGFADVNYLVKVDSSKTSVNIELNGNNITDVIVVNENNRLLENNMIKSGISVVTLGSLSINITYSSGSYTSKIGNLWTINFTASATTTLLLPKNASLLSTSIIPLDLYTVQGEQNVVLPASTFSVSYILGDVDVNPKPIEDKGYNQVFYLMAGLYVAIFGLIVFIYWRLGK